MIIIALEGIDKSGKETQARLLAEYLHSKGYSVAESGFPRYQTAIGKMIKQSLHSEIEISQMEMAKLYELDRNHAQKDFEVYKENGYDFLVLDRYTMSNLVFQRAKGLSEIDLLSLQQSLMQADLHIVVDIPVEESIRRGQAYEVLDKFERDEELLNQVRSMQLGYVEEGTYYGTGKVMSVDGLQSRDRVAEDIRNAVESTFRFK
jgi:dTMP kinase